MSFLTGTNTELIYVSKSAGTAKNTFTTEVLINDTAGMGVQAHLPADFWLPNNTSAGKAIRIVARGILSSTGTPTYTFTIRGGAAGAITGAILIGSAAVTTGSSVTNQFWELDGTFSLTAIGAAGANSSGNGIGCIINTGLSASIIPIYGGGVTPGTVTTLDTSITNFINFNVACNVSSVSNTITLQQLEVYGLN